ncbi:uncharacterized protein VTP21DRAFT_9974 [Calcarisporiella thermophila]|uniref:uncharacterized protein n=1 Tax=Calcarisporiella thermophila TaxID=911321 RepID=UPI003742E065
MALPHASRTPGVLEVMGAGEQAFAPPGLPKPMPPKIEGGKVTGTRFFCTHSPKLNFLRKLKVAKDFSLVLDQVLHNFGPPIDSPITRIRGSYQFSGW